MMTLLAHIGSIGLVFDIIGATLMFYYVLSAGEQVIRVDKNEEKVRQRIVRRKTSLAWIGFGFIVVGFILQLISNEIKVCS